MQLLYLIRRNCKLFFKDKGVFFSSLIAPLILLFLFVAFLGNVYRDSLLSIFPSGVSVPEDAVDGFCAGWLISSLLAVSAVSVSFTANMIMVQDKVMGRISDLRVTPVSGACLALSYYLSTAIVTLFICDIALLSGYLYIAISGWFLSAADVFYTILETFLLVLFGTALSSLVCALLKSQGGITAIEAIVSSAYGFLCGAYMPISSLAKGLANAISLLPGTYGTCLLHEHFMGGAIDHMNLPEAFAQKVREGFDCSVECFGTAVPEWACFLILSATIAALVGAYVLFCALKKQKKS